MNDICIRRIAGTLLLLLCAASGPLSTPASAQTEIALPDTGWRLWLDRPARWENDSLYLPADLDLRMLPVNPPTSGWNVLESAAPLNVTLPTTVEEHFWGVNGLRPYRGGEYVYESEDSAVMNGNYTGVSWWVHNVDIPADARGKKVVLFIRGARLRAEVYMNRRLVGYHIIGETSFSCDVSAAMRPGWTNQIAIRITNPGGRLDWVDTELMNWGNVSLHKSHGFGGLDRGIRLEIHGPVRCTDVHVLNTPNLDSVTAFCTALNSTGRPVDATFRFDVVDPSQGGIVVGTSHASLLIPPGVSRTASAPLVVPGAKPWSLESPRLYRLRASIESLAGKRRFADTASVTFGFRWFE
ncbi:MAG TPA: glycoside hydrolase, partial [Bacteroidota bacterium]|nr:glycoside hydrolase [Bacteroidota bacterium]